MLVYTRKLTLKGSPFIADTCSATILCFTLVYFLLGFDLSPVEDFGSGLTQLLLESILFILDYRRGGTESIPLKLAQFSSNFLCTQLG